MSGHRTSSCITETGRKTNGTDRRGGEDMKSNKGVTLLELMVVVVIIGILAGAAGLSISAIRAVSAKKAAAQLNSYLSTVRTKCMTRAGAPYAVIYVEDGEIKGTYYEYKDEDNEYSETDVITDKRVTVTYDEGTDLPDSEDKGLELKFARSTGKLSKPISSGELTFTITGGGKTYTVTVTAATGNHEVRS